MTPPTPSPVYVAVTLTQESQRLIEFYRKTPGKKRSLLTMSGPMELDGLEEEESPMYVCDTILCPSS